MADFQTFDLGRVFQTAEAINSHKRQAKTDALQERYLEQRIKEGEVQQQRQQRADEIVIGKEKAQQIDVKASQILQAPNVKGYVEQYEPDLIKNMEAAGIDWATLDDNAIKQRVQAMQNRARQELGVAPPVQLETLQDDSGAVLQRDPRTGALKQVVAPQKPDRFAETQAAADRRAAEQRAFTAQQNELNRTAGQEKAETVANAKGLKTTEGEKSAANYLTRMEASESLLDTGYQPSTKDFIASGRLMASEGGLASAIANKWISPEGQKYYQAANDWVRAKLRKESGASIPPAEMMQEIKTYFPVPGDSAEVIEQKKQARLTASEGMRQMAAKAATPKASEDNWKKGSVIKHSSGATIEILD